MSAARVAIIGLALVLGGCQSRVAVAPPVVTMADFSAGRVPGRYAVTIQTGAWKTDIGTDGWTCSFWTAATDFESAYGPSIKVAFRQNFDDVTFVTEALTADDLARSDYEAQIVVYEGGIKAGFATQQGFLTAKTIAEVHVDGIVAIIGPDGLAAQISPQGHGVSTSSVFTCADGAPAVADAGRAAIREFVIDAVSSAKRGVSDLKAR